MPLEYSLTGRWMKSPISAKASIRGRFRCISARLIPMISPLMKTFSRPENSGIETRAQFQKRGNSPARDHPARGRLQDAADHLKQSALAAAVRAHETDDFTAIHAERDIPQGPEIGVQRLVPQRIQFADAVEGRLIQPIELRDVLDKQQTTSVAAYDKTMRLRAGLGVA